MTFFGLSTQVLASSAGIPNVASPAAPQMAPLRWIVPSVDSRLTDDYRGCLAWPRGCFRPLMVAAPGRGSLAARWGEGARGVGPLTLGRHRHAAWPGERGVRLFGVAGLDNVLEVFVVCSK